MALRKSGIGLVVTALLAASATATPLPRYGMFVFSSLCIHPDSGDILGERLTLLRLNGDDAAYFEWGQGRAISR